MPMPNEHSCRLRPPGDFQDDSFRRTSRKHKGKTYDIIMGKLKGDDAMTEQAYRYGKDTWSAADARAHCKDHDGSFTAAGESDSAEPNAEVVVDAPKQEKAKEPVNLERRVMAASDVELRTEGKNPMLRGYAAKYGITTDLGFCIEKIKVGAFDEVLKNSDARAQFNHDPNLLLGRESSGTLRLDSNSVGLRFEIDVPDTSAGHDVLTLVKRGDLQGCSFAFTVAEEKWEHTDKAKSERTIIRIGELYDVGPVTFPAYPDTTVAARSLDAAKAAKPPEQCEQPAEEPKPPEEAPDTISPERQREIEKGYRKAQRIINRNKAKSPDA